MTSSFQIGKSKAKSAGFHLPHQRDKIGRLKNWTIENLRKFEFREFCDNLDLETWILWKYLEKADLWKYSHSTVEPRKLRQVYVSSKIDEIFDVTQQLEFKLQSNYNFGYHEIDAITKWNATFDSDIFGVQLYWILPHYS